MSRYNKHEERELLSEVLPVVGEQAIARLKSRHEFLDDVSVSGARVRRGYHNWDHVLDVLRALRVGLAWCVEDDERQAPLLAALYHDAVYCPGAADNEARSVAVMGDDLARHDPGVVVEVERLIMLTAGHGTHDRLSMQDEEDESDDTGALLLDADLISLSFNWPLFVERNDGVVAEYAAVFDPAAVAEGRRAFIAKMLAQPTIYLTNYFGSRHEWDARCNLQGLARLEVP